MGQNYRPGLPTHRFDCGYKASADLIRERYPDCLAPSDDRRRQAVVVVDDAPDYLIDEIRAEAAEGRAEDHERYGQVPLSKFERARLNFRQTNVFHARSVKALAVAYGVTEWLDFYDATLTVDDHHDLLMDASADTSSRTMREFPNERYAPETGQWST